MSRNETPLPPLKQKIYDLIRKRPRTVREIMDSIWWIHPQDAPQRDCIKAHIWQINRKLIGERIVGEKGGTYDGTRKDWGTYRLVKL